MPNPRLAKALHRLLDRLRAERGLTWELLAADAGLSAKTLGNWSGGTNRPSFPNAVRALEAAGLESDTADRTATALFEAHGEPIVRSGVARAHTRAAEAEADHRRALMADFENTPLFGQKTAALRDLYVWPRALWADPESLSRRPGLCGDLGGLVEKWLEDPKGRPIKLILGGPGAGKSSFAKAMAARLAARADVLPVLVPLHRSTVGLGDLVAGLGDHLERSTPLGRDTLTRLGPPCPVFLFDGLDELVLPEGPAMRQVARHFAAGLQRLVAAVPDARILVLGRTAMMEAFETQIDVSPPDVLHLAGLGELHQIRIAAPEAEAPDLLGDRRPDWWRNYAALSGEPEALPDVFRVLDFEDLTDEPLLCYLIALAGVYRQPVEETGQNQAHLYARLIDAIWERSWGSDGARPLTRARTGVAADLDRADFNALLEAVAYAAWQDGSMRVATFASFEAARDALDLGPAWQVFERDMGADLASLALTFYFRGDDRALGFEFTHQTFAEFLLARRLLNTFRHMCRDRDEDARPAETLLLEWLRFVGGATLTGNAISLLPMLAADIAPREIATASTAGLDLLNRILRDGLPTHLLPRGCCASGKALERMETAAQAAFLNCLSALAKKRDSTEPLQPDWPSQLASSEFLARFTTQRVADGAETLGIAGLSFAFAPAKRTEVGGLEVPVPGAILPGIYLAGANLSATSFRGANLDRAQLSGTTLVFADLRDARLSLADLTDAVIMNARFREADLRGADFQNAEIRDSDFGAVSGEDVRFSNASIQRCNFSKANLPDGRFAECALGEVDFSGAVLDGAVFSGSSGFDGVSFRGARLCEADFTNCDLEKADFRSANVLEAVLDGARLPPGFRDVTVEEEPNDDDDPS